MHLILLGDNMTRKRRPDFSPEFKLESAQMVVDQNYSVTGTVAFHLQILIRRKGISGHRQKSSIQI